MRPFSPLVLFLALGAVGCAPALADARSSLNLVSKMYEDVEPRVVTAYERAQTACLDEPALAAHQPCVDEVRRTWKPLRAAVEVVYKAIVVAQAGLGTAEAAAKLGKQPDLPHLLAVTSAVIQAGETMAELMAKESPLLPAPPAARARAGGAP